MDNVTTRRASRVGARAIGHVVTPQRVTALDGMGVFQIASGANHLAAVAGMPSGFLSAPSFTPSSPIMLCCLAVSRNQHRVTASLGASVAMAAWVTATSAPACCPRCFVFASSQHAVQPASSAWQLRPLQLRQQRQRQLATPIRGVQRARWPMSHTARRMLMSRQHKHCSAKSMNSCAWFHVGEPTLPYSR